MKSSMTKRVFSVFLTAALIVIPGCGSIDVQAVEQDQGEIEFDIGNGIDPKAYTGEESKTAFIGENFYDGKIENEDDALEAIESVMTRIGGDDSTDLVIEAVDETEESVYYTFRQYAEDMTVYGASVKLITDLEGNVLGLVSSIVPDIEVDPDHKWMIEQDEAEAIVKEMIKKDGLKLINGATEQTLLPDNGDNNLFHYVWVVYSTNNDPDTEQRYLAHYVDSEGTYLYCVPVNNPAGADKNTGSYASLVFDATESGTWTGTVKGPYGKEMEITVPLLIDSVTGEAYLGDLERKIICADYSDYIYNDILTPVIPEKYEWSNEALVNYYEFIRVYDFYESIGWKGPDGNGTPSLLLMHYINGDGEAEDNTFYEGQEKGFQVFGFSGTLENGEPLDILGHEFTHCVSSTAMTMNLYQNDYGAINEGLSDIMGNALEMIVDGTTEKDGAWLIGEGEGEAIRSMSDPHLYQQPEYVWDMYYVPNTAIAHDINDMGGVHINSSILNYISYELDKAGMEPEDQFYYWLNVIMAVTPRTDFYQMTELLPWCMKVSGYPEYVDVVTNAVKNSGMSGEEIPENKMENIGAVYVDIDMETIPEGLEPLVQLYDYESEQSFTTWPIGDADYALAMVPEGIYTVTVMVIDPETTEGKTYIFSQDGWEERNEYCEIDEIAEENDPAYMGLIEAGDSVELEFGTAG